MTFAERLPLLSHWCPAQGNAGTKAFIDHVRRFIENLVDGTDNAGTVFEESKDPLKSLGIFVYSEVLVAVRREEGPGPPPDDGTWTFRISHRLIGRGNFQDLGLLKKPVPMLAVLVPLLRAVCTQQNVR